MKDYVKLMNSMIDDKYRYYYGSRVNKNKQTNFEKNSLFVSFIFTLNAIIESNWQVLFDKDVTSCLKMINQATFRQKTLPSLSSSVYIGSLNFSGGSVYLEVCSLASLYTE